MDGSKNFKSTKESIQSALLATTRTAGRISAEDIAFQRSLDPEVGRALDEQSARLLALSRSLLKSAATLSTSSVPALEDADDLESNWRGVVDIIDTLLEKTDTCLDEYTGVTKQRDQLPVTKPAANKKTRSLGNAFRTQDIIKPQLTFETQIDNTDTSPWRPLLTSKPHALVPLEDSLETFVNENNHVQYRHPYEAEIQQLKYPDAVFHTAEPILYQNLEKSSAIYVDTFEGVFTMLTELKEATEIAVDLEHHDNRTYPGLVSLMQISTRQKDWIVDTLKPWRQKLEILNEVFSNPEIVKVFHGAYMDIVWLQRDLGLYVVGLFDTHWASRSLAYAGGSLAFLLKKFIDFDADKKYQLADWRIRPLPDEMFFYARADTHFLLYIYDKMRNELIERPDSETVDHIRIEYVLQKSKEVSLLRHENHVYDADTGRGPAGWYNMLVRTPSLFTNEQFAVFRAVHAWRDRIAREDDESIIFIMPHRVIIDIAKILPVDLVALNSICHSMSLNVKSRSGELLALIKAAKIDGKDGPSMMAVLRPDSVGAIAKVNAVKTASSKSAVLPVDAGPLRSEQSAFWGGAFGSSLWEPAPVVQNDTSLRLAVPLPPLSSDAFADSDRLIEEQRMPTAESPLTLIPMRSSRKGAGDPFVLKPGAKPDRNLVSEDSEDNEGHGIVFDQETIDTREGPVSEKRATPQEKKLKRIARKEAQKQGQQVIRSSEPSSDVGEEHFDYSKAESVLHAKRKEEEQGGRDRKKPFDPYKKSADAPKGMRRLQSGQPGKSFTFKS